MLARLPESDASMPRRSLRSRAYQLAAEPESAATMQRSGKRGDNSQNTRCGYMGRVLLYARATRSFPHAEPIFSIFFCYTRLFFRFICFIIVRRKTKQKTTKPTTNK